MHPDIPIYNTKAREVVDRLHMDLLAAFGETPTLPSPAIPETEPVSEAVSPVREVNGERINYEEMIITAIKTLNDPQGSPPKEIYKWLSANYPMLEGRDVRTEGTAVLNRLLKAGRLVRENHMYRVSERGLVRLSLNSPAGRALLSSLQDDPEIEPSPEIENFPAPGTGVKLPPETEDMDHLIQREPIGFSHNFSYSNGITA